MADPTYIDAYEDLQTLCTKLVGADVIAVDTEFVGERSYYPRLALIQIAAYGEEWIIDPIAITDLHPLKEVLSNEKTVVLMHSGETDLPILNRACGVEIPNLFDTQLAYAFVGNIEQIGLLLAVRKIVGKRLAKGQQVTNWLHRPLTEKQINYAAADVEYLERIYNYLLKKLKSSKRIKYFEEEMEIHKKRWLTPVLIEKRFRKMLNKSRMTIRKREALIALLEWREETAIKFDKPRRHIISDEAISAIADDLPTSIQELHSNRLISERAVKKYGKQINAICEKIRSVPVDKIYPQKRPAKNNSRIKSRIPIVKMAMEAIAGEAGISHGLIARASEIEELCRAASNSATPPDLPCMQGWKGRLIGKKLWQFARGEVSLRVGLNPKGPAIILEKIADD